MSETRLTKEALSILSRAIEQENAPAMLSCLAELAWIHVTEVKETGRRSQPGVVTGTKWLPHAWGGFITRDWIRDNLNLYTKARTLQRLDKIFDEVESLITPGSAVLVPTKFGTTVITTPLPEMIGRREKMFKLQQGILLPSAAKSLKAS
jgi:hypothetical protein